MQSETRWYHYIAYFFGGAFLANTIPHLVNGMSGSSVSEPVCNAGREGPVVVDGQCLVGNVQPGRGLHSAGSRGPFRAAEDESCS